MEPLLLPDTIVGGRYRVVQFIARGGMGAVYEVVDQRLGIHLALKQMMVSGSRLDAAFEREAQLLAALRHPALPRVIDYFSDTDGKFLVMDFIRGSNLADLLAQRRKPFAVEQGLVWMDQVLQTLEYLHSQKPPVIHRDIKPLNLKITAEGQIVLLDFGLAKGPAPLQPSTASGMSVFGGTPIYSPLEQMQGTGTDIRSDLYALAATFHHLLTGIPPVGALARAAAFVNSEPDPQPAAHDLNPQVPAPIGELLLQTMALSKDKRPATSAELRLALTHIARQIAGSLGESRGAQGAAPQLVSEIVPAETYAAHTKARASAASTSTAVTTAERADATSIKRIPNRFRASVPLRQPDSDLFHGRGDILSKIKNSFYGGVQRERYYLEGIRGVGKTTVINFLFAHLPESILLVPIDATELLSGRATPAATLRWLCEHMQKSGYEATGILVALAAQAVFDDDPTQAWRSFLHAFRAALPKRMPLLVIEDFHQFLRALVVTSPEHAPDTLVLDQLKAYADQSWIAFLLTGTLRFDRLPTVVESRIFGSLTRLHVPFISHEATSDTLRAGLQGLAAISDTILRQLYELTGGYPLHVQAYGAALIERLNRVERDVVTFDDVHSVTQAMLQDNPAFFTQRWPSDHLGFHEERLIEHLLRDVPDDRPAPIAQILANGPLRNHALFMQSLDNLRAYDVVVVTSHNEVQIRGALFRKWLRNQFQSDGQLRLSTSLAGRGESSGAIRMGESGIFIDHDNLLQTLAKIDWAPTTERPDDRKARFEAALAAILRLAEQRYGTLRFKTAVAFWEYPQNAALLPAYLRLGFTVVSPEHVKQDSAIAFMLADAIHRASRQAMIENSKLARAIILTGGGDLSHTARTLVNDGVEVHVWAGSADIANIYRDIVGGYQAITLDDVLRS